MRETGFEARDDPDGGEILHHAQRTPDPTLLPLPVQGHARAMAPAGNVGDGGGGAAKTAGRG